MRKKFLRCLRLRRVALANFPLSMPMNMPTHAHGQGYADVNMLIPELIGSISIEKGPSSRCSCGSRSLASSERAKKFAVALGGKIL